MTAYDLLSNPERLPVLAGQWCSHDSFNAVQAGTLQGQLKASVTCRLISAKISRIDRLRRWHGSAAHQRTAPAIFPPCCRCCRSSRCFRFWEQDDEFPAQLQFLWDRNSMRYLTYETSFYTHRAILDRLLEADM